MITASIVLYNNDRSILKKAIDSFLYSKTSHEIFLYLIDNSPSDALKSISADVRIQYIHNPSNPGFGSAHNLALQMVTNNKSIYHFVINPDVYFKDSVISPMIDFMEKYEEVGMMMPQILNEDGSIQMLPKLLPSPLSILKRKVKAPRKLYNKFIDRYELRTVPQDVIYNAPILSGCFTLFRISALKEIGFYDDRYFMYFEDWDISRRMHEKYKTIYFPKVSVVHGYESGANKSKKLFKIFLTSAGRYFSKWGWIYDARRREINEECLKQFK